MDDKDIVSAVFLHLADKVGQDRFELWFGAQVRLTISDSTATVEVPNRFYQDWLRRNFRRDVEAACHEVLGRAAAVEFRIDPTLDSKSTPRAEVPCSVQATFDFADSSGNDQIAPGGNAATAVLEPRRAVQPVRPEAVLPESSVCARKFATFETFVVGKRQQTRICRRRERGPTTGQDQSAFGLRVHRHRKDAPIRGDLE